MMLKINKTLPKNKARHNSYTKVNNNATYSSYCNTTTKRINYLGLATLICGIMPGLMWLGSYTIPAQKVSAAEEPQKTIDNIKYMQELSKEVCDAAAKGTSTTLIDLRDDSEYGVAKLNDGKCWMTQNLKLDLTQAGIATVDESDNLTAAFPENALESLGIFTNDNTAVQFSKSPTISTQYPGDGKGYKPEYGYYYSWCAATGSTCDTATESSDIASGSICPKGWRLPTGGNKGDFQILYNIWTTATWTTYNNLNGRWLGANNTASGGSFFQATGGIEVDGLRDSGSSGHYSSNTSSSTKGAYGLSLNNSTINPVYSNNKYIGRTIRCISADIPEAELPKDNIPSYPPIVKDRNTAEVVAVVVPPVISIDAAEGDSIEVDPNMVSNGTITAKVSANTNYIVQLSANQTSLLDPNTPDNPGIPASSNVVAKTNAWGIRNEDNTYSAITSTPTTYYNTTTTNEDLSTTHTFSIGVSVSPTLPTGIYSTTVTITAVNN